MQPRFKIPTYTPSNWYWVVQDTNTIYSSAERNVVDATDQAFVAWSVTNSPTKIPNMTELLDVLRAQAPECLPTAAVPETVTPRQAFLALLSQGITEQGLVDSINTNLPENQRAAALVTLQKSLEFQRSNPMVQVLGALVGLDSTDMDNLFIAAAQL